MMYRPISLLILALVTLATGFDGQQTVQEPDRLPLLKDEGSLSDLERNVSALWTYIYELRGAVTHHLNHLRQHQVEMEEAIHRMEHHSDGHGGDSHASHTSDHSSSHSGEDHSHGHSSGEHSGGGHSSSGEHHHHHSGEHHSHSDDHHHHHSGESSHGHSHDSHSDAAAGHGDHGHGDHGHGDHGHDHKDSHETSSDDLQQTSQVSEPLVEPVIVPTTRESHRHHHSHSHSHSSHSHGGASTGSGSSTFQPLNVMGGDHHHSHGGSSSSMVRNRTRTVTMPKFSEYDLYEFATCTVQPNRAIPVEQQQSIVGQIALWQKKSGGPLNIHVRLSGFAMGDHHAHHQQQQQQEEDNETPMVHKHGFHVHTLADFSNGCQSTGPHYNPKGVNHGGPKALVRHVGDLGNIECDDHGVANLVFSDNVASLKGPYSIVGKSMVIHAGPDDLGLGGDEESLRTGNAGARLACCAIQKVDKLPIRSYKAIKTALQYQN